MSERAATAPGAAHELGGVRVRARPRPLAAPAPQEKADAGQLPPGPRLPRAIQTLLFVRDPVRFFERCRRRYGGAVSVDLLGFGRTVWITDPALVRRAIASPEDLRAGRAANVAEPIFGSHSVVTSDGADHTERRRRLRPSFHADRLQRYEETFERAAAAELETWRPGHELRLLPAIYRITMEVILEAVLGVRDASRRQRIARAVGRVAAMGNLAALGPAFRRDLGPLSPGGRFRRRMVALDRLIGEEIAVARREVGSGPGAGAGWAAGRGDVAALLAGAHRADGSPLPELEIRDELVSLIIAGQETTGAALAWAFDLLLRHPDALARVIAEADTGEHGYTEAAIKESLRVRPPVIAAARIATEPVELGGWLIPAGTRVWTPMTLIQRRPDLFPEPRRFRPERFLDAKPDPFTWIPFGGGNRRCIGASFALLEMRVVLHTVLRRIHLSPVPAEPERGSLNNVIIEPSRGMRVLVAGPRSGPGQEASAAGSRSSAVSSASTTSGSNCVPEQARSSSRAAPSPIAGR